jgi:predicted ATPase
MPCGVTAQELIGRDEEIREISSFLESIGRLPSALVLEGEPGIGKTTLWRRAVAEAHERGYRILSCSPAETEAELAYAAVADLLDGALDAVERELPPPQRRALRIALLLEDAGEAEPDRCAIAVALLGALRRLAVRSPVLVAIDDVQWVDASSNAALRRAAPAPRQQARFTVSE